MHLLQPKRFLLKVGYACNNHCLFCHAAPHMGTDSPTFVLEEKVRNAAKAGAEEIVLSGGEPTIRRDLAEVIAGISGLGLGLGLVTNARMLVYRRVRNILLGGGLDYVQVSFAAGNAKAHDAVVGVPGAFEQAKEGIVSLLSETSGPLDVTLSCVLTKPCLATLDELAELAVQAAGQAAPLAKLRLKLSLLELEGRAIDHADSLNPGLATTAKALGEMARRHGAMLRAAGVELVQEGLPSCLAAGVPPSDLWTDGFVAMSEAFERDWHPVDDANHHRPPSCIDCSEDGCPGPYATTLAQEKDDHILVPIRARRPGNQPFVPTRSHFIVGPVDDAPCPIRAGRIPSGPRWALWTKHKDQQTGLWTWTLWQAAGKDFSPRDHRRLLDELEQVYIEAPGDARTSPRSRGPFRGLQPLRRSALCRACPRRLTCLGLFEPIADKTPTGHLEDVVDRDAKLLETRLQSASGSVLDVGSGTEPAYLSTLTHMIEQGRISYLGLDPAVDGNHGNAPASNPGFVQGKAEEMEGIVAAQAGLDWIWSIRSLAHYEKPSRFFEQASKLLTDEGRLLLVSDRPFILLTTTQPRQAGEADLEHWQNPSLEFLEAAVRRWGFEVEWIRPAGPATSNLDFIQARRKPTPD